MKETTISYKEKMNNRKEESNLDCASKNVQQQRDQKCTCILGMAIKEQHGKEVGVPEMRMLGQMCGHIRKTRYEMIVYEEILWHRL